MLSPISDAQDLARTHGVDPEVFDSVLASVRFSMSPLTREVEFIENGTRRTLLVTRRGLGPITNKFGDFQLLIFSVNDQWENYMCIVKGELKPDNFNPAFRDPQNLLLRIDSGCATGQVYGDATCECRDQLELAMRRIAEAGEGLIICIPHQDGRGMGLNFKLATLRLQKELGLDTVDAASLVAGSNAIDVRSYGGTVAVLKFLEFPTSTRLKLLSNNPLKTRVLTENGFTFELEPVIAPATEHTIRHLIAKQEKLGHVDLIVDRDGGGS